MTGMQKLTHKKFILGLITLMLCSHVLNAQFWTGASRAKALTTVDTVVGAIGGAGGAGGLGGANYTIPIQVPKGLGGLQPSIAVAYNSQGGNGLLGWCWDLQGFSSITRMGTTQYHDERMSGVDFYNDRFALDGQRLICVSGTCGGNNAEYRTETDGMARIVSYTCDTTAGPACFKVWLPNGNIAYYGYSQESRIGLQQRNDVCLWLLNRVEDRNGNYMEYHYNRGRASYTLTSICYGGNSIEEIPCSYTVSFVYSQRDDAEISFIGDNTLDQKKRLDTIAVMHGTTELHRYWFDYYIPNLSDGYYYTRLRQVSFVCDNEAYNPTVIQWGENDYGSCGSEQDHYMAVTGGSSTDFSGKVKFTGDFNGDGYTDFILYYPHLEDYKKAVFFINRGLASNGSVAFLQHATKITLDEDIDWIYTPDINGDGLDDIVLSSRKRPLLGKDKLTLKAYLSSVDPDGSYHFTEIQNSFGEFRIKKKYHETLLTGDFLGEGKQSFLLQECDDNKADPRLFYITCSNGALSAQLLPQNMVLDADKMFACDFNGDGVSEIYFMNEDNVTTGLLRMRRSGTSYAYETVNNNMLSPWHQVFPGDFNGDGKPDLLSYVEDNNGNPSWHLHYFKESTLRWPSFTISEQTIGIGNPGIHGYSLQYLNDPDYKFITVGDFNGDGKADVAVRTENDQMKFLYGPVRNVNGQGQFASTQTVSLGNMGMSNVSNQTICTGNFLGQENIGVFSNYTLYALNPLSNRYCVANITDGMGNRVGFEYDYLMPKPSGASATDFYVRTIQTSLEQAADMFSVSLPIKGLSRMVSSNIHCPDPVAEERYRYNTAMVHKRGRGFLGFKSTTTENWLASSKQQTVERNLETMTSVPSLALKTETVKSGDGSVAAVTENTNAVLLWRMSGGTIRKIFVPVVGKQTGCSYDLDHPERLLKKSITEYAYNDTVLNLTGYGQIGVYTLLKQTDVRQGVDSIGSVNAASACEFQTLTHTDYYAETPSDLQDWIINRPRSIRSTARRLGDYNDISSLMVYHYADGQDGGPFLPSRVVTYPGGVEDPDDPLATLDSTAYSTTGLVKKKITLDLASTLPQKTETYDYSPDGRFVTSECNTLGYTVYYEHDDDYGFLLSETDHNGLQTRYKSSPVGAWKATYPPNGVQFTTETLWIDHGDVLAPEGAFYSQKDHFQDGREKRTYFDALGRKLRTVSQGMRTELVLKDFVYNNKGFLAAESIPYFYGSNTRYWTEYSYDSHDRLFITEHPDGTGEVVFFDGHRTTLAIYSEDLDDPLCSSTTVNAAGWMVKSADESGTEVRYDHYADGRLMSAQLGNDDGTAVSAEYDDAGNRIMLNDPNYGPVRNHYDAYGRLTATDNPSGESTEYRYDALGRMVKRYEYNRSTGLNDSTEWVYSEIPGEKGLLRSIQFNGTKQAVGYFYDTLNRVSMVQERRGDDVYITCYTYDSISRIRTVTYPSGFVVRKHYTPTGHLDTLYNASNHAMLWATEEKNAYGQVTRYSMGNGVTAKRQYDPLTGCLTEIVSSKENDILQDLSYVFDKNANLASRKDNLRNMEERFLYDRLNRLTGVVEGNDTTGVFAYDNYGRMTMKYLHGATVFDNTSFEADGRPHALERARMYNAPPEQTLAYTSFDKLCTIDQDDPAPRVHRYLRYDYGYEHQRIRVTEAVSTDTVVKDYVGNCEFFRQNGVFDPLPPSLTYLTGPLGVFAVFDSRIQPASKGMYYVHPDHLGSWTTVTGWNGTVVQDVHFDPWGTPYYSDSTHLVEASSLLFNRGFTGHEHMTAFGLVNMNGRVYDPVTSTFLSVDNFVQDPSSTQNFNRYAYCMNNPLKYTDPDGEWAHLVIGALVGGVANVFSNLKHINTFGEGLAYFGIGAVAGVAGAAAGGAVAGAMKLGGFVSGALSGAAGGASSGMISGSGNAWMQGANFGQGLKAGGIAAGIGAGTGALFGGLTRGIVDYRKGYNFWDGTKITNYEVETIKLSELYPNKNFNYDDYQIKECADFTDLKLKTRTSHAFGIEQGDMGIELLTTNPNNAVGPSKGYTLLTDGTYQTADGRNSLGYTFETTAGYSEVHVSPYAATHSNCAIFKAVVGHELTHSYHYFVNLPVSELGPSEGAALRYSAKVYQSYGMTAAYEATVKSIQTIPYYPNYAVPNTYTFSLKW